MREVHPYFIEAFLDGGGQSQAVENSERLET